MKKAYTVLFLMLLVVTSPGFVFAQSKTETLIRNATVLTAAKGTLENTDILIQNGKIAKIGKNLKASSNAQVIDASGKFVTPGIIDCHSHSMLDAINEGSYSVTSMVRTRDVVNPTDIAIYRALAGGVTWQICYTVRQIPSVDKTRWLNSNTGILSKTFLSPTHRPASSSRSVRTSNARIFRRNRDNRRVIRAHEWV